MNYFVGATIKQGARVSPPPQRIVARVLTHLTASRPTRPALKKFSASLGMYQTPNLSLSGFSFTRDSDGSISFPIKDSI